MESFTACGISGCDNASVASESTSDKSSTSDYDLTQSPFASVIETNYNPSQEDIVHLKTLLAEPQLQLSQLESEIARLNDQLESLFFKRASVKGYIEAHRALLSPVRRLPEETLSEIFIHCLPEDHYAVRDLSEAPLLLTAISRQWRQTAIGTPALWKSLHIFLPWGISTQCAEKRTIGSSLWLKRSGSLPLYISLSMETPLFDGRRRLRGSAMEWIHTFIAETMSKYSHRIKELSFMESNGLDMAGHLDRLASHSFPILNVFHVRLTEVSHSRTTEEPILPFASIVQKMPALRNLAMIGFHHSGRQYMQLELGWENLLVLVLKPSPTNHSASFSSQEILIMLGCACRLQSLTMSVDIAGASWSTNTATVLNLPAMREMRITFLGLRQQTISQARICLQNFYHSIICPSLKTLYASWLGMQWEEMPFSFTSLAELETLSLDMPLNPSTLIESLALAPRLRFLEITTKGLKVDSGHPQAQINIPLSLIHTVNDSVITSLVSFELDTGKKRRHILCPDLQHIRILYKDTLCSSITNNAILTLLESRVQAKMLQSCDVFFSRPQAESTEDETRRFRALVDSGLKLRIHCGRFSPSFTSGNDTPRAGLLTINPPDLSDMEGPYGADIMI